MRLWRILAIAAAVELALLAAVAAVAGLAGAWSPWLDVLNALAPLWLILGAAGALVGAAAIPSGRVRAGVLILSAVAALAAGVRLTPELARGFGPRAPAPPGAGVRVLSLNVWEDNLDPELTLRRIVEAQADVVTLQERGGRLRAILPELLRRFPGRTRCSGQAAELLILSRRPALASGCRGQRQGEGPTRIAWLNARDARGRPFTVVTTHLGWPVPAGGQSRQKQGLAAFLHGLDPDSVILTGDFNTAAWTANMTRQDSLLRPLSRRTIGLATWPAAWPRVEWPAPFPFLPIDHVYAGPAWRTARIARGPVTGSDHYPVVADLWRP